MVVRAGCAPALARLYPPLADTGPALDAALRAAIAEQGGDLVGLIESAPQTNEVARSGILLGGLLTVAAETGLVLALNEVGASAGLNLHPDCYAYDFGRGHRWGPADAPLTIACDWRGAAPPLDARLEIASRAGSDLAPIDPADAQARERLLGYIWPDQPARLERTAGTESAGLVAVSAAAGAASWASSLARTARFSGSMMRAAKPRPFMASEA